MPAVRQRRGLDVAGACVFRASAAQSRMWFVHQISTDGGRNGHVRATVRIFGKLDRVAFQRAFDQVVARHDALRTGVDVVDGVPMQVVIPSARVAVTVVDCSSPAELDMLSDRLASEPFDLAAPPLMRCALARSGPQEHHLLLVIHHIVCDAWSIGVLLRDLAQRYQNCAGSTDHTVGAIIDPPSLDVQAGVSDDVMQFPDVAEWQLDRLTGRIDRLLEFWTGKLNGAPRLELPLDHPRKPDRDSSGAVCRTVLPARSVRSLRADAIRNGGTLTTALLTGITAVLGRWCAASDITVGLMVAGRDHPDLQEVVGPLLNTVPLRTDLDGTLTYRAAFDRVLQSTTDALAHSEIPFDRLVSELEIGRDPSRSPIVDVVVNVLDTPFPPIEVAGLTFQPVEDHSRTTRADLCLVVRTEPNGGIECQMEYAVSLFERGTVQAVLDDVAGFLQNAAAAPRADLDQLHPVGSPAHDSTPMLIPAPTIVQQFRDQASTTPDRKAVGDSRIELTYRHLADRVERLAAGISQFAGGRPVGVRMERSADLPAVLLACLWSGSTYVPVDLEAPPARAARMFRQAGVGLVIETSESIVAPDDSSGEHSWVTRTPDQLAAVINPAGEPATSYIAYVLFTSGSTGVPKGVAVTESALRRHLAALRHACQLPAASRWAAITDVSFDIAGVELLFPLLHGGSVEVLSHGQTSDGCLLAAALTELSPQIVQATPSTWRMLTASGWRPKVRPIALVGGEGWESSLAEDLVDLTTGIWNVYGPTESTIWVSAAEVRRGEPIVLGRPLPGCGWHILDDRLKPVPDGMPGELYLCGGLLADGYVGDPVNTARAFVPHPCTQGVPVGSRMYRTGDLVRRTADGVRYLGRRDGQVKVRGHRIETGEVESVLRSDPAISDAAVVAVNAGPSDVRLTGYLVEVPGRVVDLNAVRRTLATAVPSYAVPAPLVVLPTLPRTSSGKIDRGALRARGVSSNGGGSDQTLPRTTLERQIADAFAKVLQCDGIGVHASFFDLGGHSLLAAQLVHEIANRTGCTLALREIVRTPTVAALAEEIDRIRATTVSHRDTVAAMSEAQIDGLLAQIDAVPAGTVRS